MKGCVYAPDYNFEICIGVTRFSVVCEMKHF